MRWLALLLRIIGWLLTPFVVWAASFLGTWVGSVVAARVETPRSALYVAVAFGVVFGLVTTLLWVRALRRSPKLRHSLHVTREGVPVLEGAFPAAHESTPDHAAPPAP